MESICTYNYNGISFRKGMDIHAFFLWKKADLSKRRGFFIKYENCGIISLPKLVKNR